MADDNGQHAAKIGRDGRVPKRLTDTPTTPGMTRQTKGKLHLWAHGQAVDDEIADKLSATGKNVPTAFGQVTQPKSNSGDRLRGTHDREAGSRILDEAARLGNPKKK